MHTYTFGYHAYAPSFNYDTYDYYDCLVTAYINGYHCYYSTIAYSNSYSYTTSTSADTT